MLYESKWIWLLRKTQVNMKLTHMLSVIHILVFGIAANSNAIAETVYVKYRGVVNLDKFVCYNPSSSLVHRICYRENNQYLVVLLKQTYYHYCKISPGIVNQLINASSKGRFYGRNIKGNYDCRLGGIPNN